jgi:hypothetical protein
VNDLVCELLAAIVRVSTYTDSPETISAGAALQRVQRGLHGVLYVHGGWQTIVDQLRASSERSGVEIFVGSEVVSVIADRRVQGMPCVLRTGVSQAHRSRSAAERETMNHGRLRSRQVPLAARGTDCGVAFPTTQATDARPSDDLPHSSTPHAPSHDHGGRRSVDVSSGAGSESPASYLKYNRDPHSVHSIPFPGVGIRASAQTRVISSSFVMGTLRRPRRALAQGALSQSVTGARRRGMPLAFMSWHEENDPRGGDIDIDDGSSHGGAARRRLSEADDTAWRAGPEGDDPCDFAAWRFDNARTLDCESRREHARRWSLHDEVHDQRVVSKNHEDDKEDGDHHYDFCSDYDDDVDDADDHADNDDDAVAGAAEAAAEHQPREQAAIAPARGDESHGGLVGVP